MLWCDSPVMVDWIRPSSTRPSTAGSVVASSTNSPPISSGGSTPTTKKSRGRTSRASATQTIDEAQVEEEAHAARDGHVEGDHGEGERRPERDHGGAGLAPLLPQRAGLGHIATVGRSSGSSGAARRDGPRSTARSSTRRGESRSSTWTPRSPKRRAVTSTRVSREPIARL